MNNNSFQITCITCRKKILSRNYPRHVKTKLHIRNTERDGSQYVIKDPKFITTKNGAVHVYENSKYKTFKERYKDPEYRKKFLAKHIYQSIECSRCKLTIKKTNLSRHLKTKRCLKSIK